MFKNNINIYSIFFKVFVLIGVLNLYSCSQDRLKVDISNIDVDINVKRLDSVLFDFDSTITWDDVKVLSEDYSKFWDIYTMKIIGIGMPNNIDFISVLNKFRTNVTIVEAYKSSQEIYSDFSFVKLELEKAFKHYKYYYPNSSIPDVYTYIGGFNQSVVTDEGILGIGLDKYLGSNSLFYSMLNTPNYLRNTLSKENITVDCMRAWALMEFEFENEQNNLINNMIYNGKILYFVNAMLPSYPDSSFIQYTNTQLEWCKNSEKDMWIHFIENKLLFSSEYKNQIHFINPAPYTTAFSNNSPGRTGVWIGWQIVKKYMDKNSDISLQNLMKENDYQKILNMSRYNP